MRHNAQLVLVALATVALALTGFSLRAQDDEIRAIRDALQYYLDGHATGRRDIMEQAFHASARLQSIRDGAVFIQPIEDWLDARPGRPAADENRRRRRVVSIDRHGTAALAKIELNYPDVTYVDYMQMLKIGDEWKIVNKIFHAERK